MFEEADVQMPVTRLKLILSPRSYTQRSSQAINPHIIFSCGEERNTRLIMSKQYFTQLLPYKKTKKQLICLSTHGVLRQICSLLVQIRICSTVSASSVGRLRLVRRAGRRGLVIAAVHFLLHGAVLFQLLACVVRDLQEAAGLHHHVGLAGVWQN